jgi:hypothetical protein
MASNFTGLIHDNRIGKDVCYICGRVPSNPWRVYDERGKVRFGCVGHAHTGQLVTPSESAWFHNTADAKRIRRMIEQHGGQANRSRRAEVA